ncbi:MAG: putative quinol monooxygenase [Rhodospirillales bacterium]
MSRFAIFVTIKLKPGTADAFRPLILENAAAAVREEPDCHQFDVMTAEDDPDTFYFYEVYADAQALDRHRDTAHYQNYMAQGGDMIEDRVIQRCTVLTG